MGAGAFIIFAGLCFLPSAFGADGDRTMLGAGSVVIAMGLLLVAGGFYLKARALSSTTPSNASAPAKRNRSKSACDICAEDESVIQCRVHQLHLCPACLSKHYDFRSCAYVPSARRGNPKANAAVSSSS
jgi:hypothetical protein